jgi:murein DD-endopeptidase MepM/ murein hydrolase activator NlpD
MKVTINIFLILLNFVTLGQSYHEIALVRKEKIETIRLERQSQIDLLKKKRVQKPSNLKVEIKTASIATESNYNSSQKENISVVPVTVKLTYKHEFIPDLFPLPQDSFWVSSQFSSSRYHPILKRFRSHNGIDLAADMGTPIYATASGIVTEACDDRKDAGSQIQITHNESKYKTHYFHLSQRLVKVGDYVHKGDIIGLVGSTGLSTGPHLHYEVLKDGTFQDPMNYMDIYKTALP